VIDFSLTADQRAFAAAATGTMHDRPDAGGPDTAASTWRALAELGAFTLLTDEGGGDVRDVVAVMGALGAARCPGAIVATVAAGPLLTVAERTRLSAGELRVSVAVDGYLPWPDTADVVLEVDGDDVWRVAWEAKAPPSMTFSGEPWVAVQTQRERRLPGGDGFLVAAELALAAAVLGMGHSLLERAAAHARTRVQFGKPIGAFQGVAHPLAHSWARLTAADELVRLVATETVLGARSTVRSRLARAEATDAALQTSYAVHQAMGGLSFAVETGIGAVSTRIRQWTFLLPGPQLAPSGNGNDGSARQPADTAHSQEHGSHRPL
jgi:alkylation response protein AidB-like acyl-CoA dehydrogenase